MTRMTDEERMTMDDGAAKMLAFLAVPHEVRMVLTSGERMEMIGNYDALDRLRCVGALERLGLVTRGPCSEITPSGLAVLAHATECDNG